MAFLPIPCPPGSGGGGGTPPQDVEQNLLCDVGPDGEVLGTALAVYEYDPDGNPVGPPTFVNPATGDPYVAQGTLQPCPGDASCLPPVQFCFQSSASVDQPGRMYDATLSIAQGFGVQAIIKDLVEFPVNIAWDINDVDGSQFAADLQTAIQSQFPGQTVTVTPPVIDGTCGDPEDFQIHIECLRIDQNPPTLLQLKYNGGRDLIQNPAFVTATPLIDNGNVRFLRREDQAAALAETTINCTNIANRGWETNDKSNVFESWGLPGNIYNTASGTTPTPRGTPIHEINAFGSGPTPTGGAQNGDGNFGVNPNTIWQTFQVPANGNFTIRVTVGGRAGTENIGIKLSSGDVGDAGVGDVISTSVNAAQVTTQDPTGAANGTGGPAQPWTVFTQTVPLSAGLYTLAFTGPNTEDAPGGANSFGGLFTDMRVFQDAPNTIEDFTNNDETCVVPSTEISTICEYWTPICGGGEITGWRNTADGELLSNAEFWGQVPAPTCCPSSSGGGTSSAGNLVDSYAVCGVVAGIPTTLQRVIITDQAGGIISQTFIGPEGSPVTPDSFTIGECSATRFLHDQILCDDNGRFMRKYIQALTGQGTAFVSSVSDFTLNGQPYAASGLVVDCAERTRDTETQLVCDAASSTTLIATYVYDESGAIVSTTYYGLDGSGPLVADGPFYEGGCCQTVDLGTICYDAGGDVRQAVGQRRCRTDDPSLFDTFFYDSVTGEFLGGAADLTVVDCPGADGGSFDFEEHVLCDATGTSFLRRFIYIDGVVQPVADFDLDGNPYVPEGAVAPCDLGSPVVLGEVCYATPTGETAPFRANLDNTSVAGPPGTFTWTNFAGSGVDVTVSSPVASQLGDRIQINPGAGDPVTITFSQPVNLKALQAGELDGTGQETWANFVPNFTGLTGTLIESPAPGNVRSTINNGSPDGDILFNSTTNSLAFIAAGQGLGSWLMQLEFTLNLLGDQGRAVVVRCEGCEGGVSYYDLQTGAEINSPALVECLPQEVTVTNFPTTPPPPTPITLSSQGRVLADADPAWTPGTDVTGTLTSVTLTILSGTANVIDSNGTVLNGLPAGLSLTWTSEDANILTGPQSIDAIGGQTIVHWSEK